MENQNLQPEDQQKYTQMLDQFGSGDVKHLRIGFGKRLGAALIDMVFMYIIIAVVLLATGMLSEVIEAYKNAVADPQGVKDVMTNAMPIMVFLSVVYWSLEIWFAAAPGKMILGIQIASQDMKQASLGTLLVRFIIKNGGEVFQILLILTAIELFSTFSTIYGIIILIGFFFVLGANRKAFHDMVAGTAVYRKKDVIVAEE